VCLGLNFALALCFAGIEGKREKKKVLRNVSCFPSNGVESWGQNRRGGIFGGVMVGGGPMTRKTKLSIWRRP